VTAPCEGLRVVEVAVGASDLGLGLAAGVPGMLLAELGADVTRVTSHQPVGIDEGLTWSRVWHRHKELVRTDDPDEVRRLVASADVALVYGPEELVEGRGLSWVDLASEHPRLVLVRCRPSQVADGTVPDHGLLVEARSGFCTQLAGHRPGPIFVDVRAPGSGAAFLMTASALSLLHRRELTGEGGWAETSLYDGMLATLGCMIGRSEHAPADVEGYWRDGSTFPNFLYRCADGELIQVWFGGKGMYPKLLAVLGDEPSEQGYYADQVSGQLQARAKRWNDLFRARTRDEWMALLRAEGVACEPVNGPGDALADPHLAQIGLARQEDGDLLLGTPVTVEALADPPGHVQDEAPARPLAGLRVVDFSAFVAGPLGAQVLADLGADVIKVEPPTGEAMRAAAYAVAACQRGKRSLALDLGAPEARPAVEGLLRWADVVLHNFRVGVAERLGIGADRVAELRPDAVYCHASGFGPRGPRSKLPGNDALMQAVTGFEVAVGGEGNDPLAGTWIPIDMAGGWVAAIGMLAGCYARVRTGLGQKVDTSLLGAGMLLQSGTFQRDGEVVRGPRLDGDQTGYGPGYRIYRAADGTWLAVVVPDAAAWRGLGDALGADLPGYVPLRDGRDDTAAVAAEQAIAEAVAMKPAGEWLTPLRAAGVLVEVVREHTRDQFRSGILDDAVNRRLGRVATYRTDDWGRLEQIGPLLRHGPEPWPGPPMQLPGIGEHTVEALRIAGLDEPAITALLDAGVAVQHDRAEGT
jgi:crotonobetainyl-CoA:carnitine CoA-transferase CaiB-like acyl-CoA transferase